MPKRCNCGAEEMFRFLAKNAEYSLRVQEFPNKDNTDSTKIIVIYPENKPRNLVLLNWDERECTICYNPDRLPEIAGLEELIRSLEKKGYSIGFSS